MTYKKICRAGEFIVGDQFVFNGCENPFVVVGPARPPYPNADVVFVRVQTPGTTGETIEFEMMIKADHYFYIDREVKNERPMEASADQRLGDG